jgi:5-methylcytosine-specific restriction endonuclease McrA
MVTTFAEVHPSLDNYWRAIILFGRNVASYKFALGKTLLEAAQQRKTFLPLTEVALPFARHIAAHLKLADKQATSRSSRFLDSCRRFNRGELSEEQLADVTAHLGFNNVIDAFHVVGSGDAGVRFYTDERHTPGKGIRLTDEVFRLTELYQHRNLPFEVEARWRLVETAWELNLPTSALVVAYDSGPKCLVAESRLTQRKPITSCRDALNGYQRGKCFYCSRDISVLEGTDDLADVDHLFPHVLKVRLAGSSLAALIDGVWNLVLACQRCNRGEDGKFDRPPHLDYLVRLRTRNDFLIESHHPLRETLMLQTGETRQDREQFLREAYRYARTDGGLVGEPWRAADESDPAF